MRTFAKNADYFAEHINSIENTLPLVMMVTDEATKQAEEEVQEFISKGYATIASQDEDTITYRIDRDHMRQFKELQNNLHDVELAIKIIPRSFLVTLVSQYDAYIGSLIRTMFEIKPEMLNSVDKSISLSQIIKYSSIDQVKEAIIEKEIEAVLRKSHSEQFEWLENKLNIKLRKDLSIWPDFIELTERRNLFVHCDGIVSEQYMNVCKENGVSLEKELCIGDQLRVGPRYFEKSVNCIFELGIKLVQVLWRKLCPDELDNADKNLTDICYELILKEKYSLAIALLEFATEVLKKYASEENRLTFIINKAQAYKWNGDEKLCIDIVRKIDWSAYNDIYRLAKLCTS